MLHLLVGLPGAGKTVRARELEARLPALRLTPDEWHQAVFDDDGPHAWRSRERVAHRDRIEGKLVETGLRAARLGLDVVLDLGLWSRDERSALRWLAGSLGVRAEVVYLPVRPDEQVRRLALRQEREPRGFSMTQDELRRWQDGFEVPDEEELAGGPVPPAPAGHASWASWAADRWPSLVVPRDDGTGGAVTPARR